MLLPLVIGLREWMARLVPCLIGKALRAFNFKIREVMDYYHVKEVILNQYGVTSTSGKQNNDLKLNVIIVRDLVVTRSRWMLVCPYFIKKAAFMGKEPLTILGRLKPK